MYKINELRKMPREELLSLLSSERADLMKLRIQLKSGVTNSDNINNYRNKRKLIARIKTILKELELINK
ncbi:MAG: 50S ribosomal protein L29 [Candidatus Dojkabacteria bacterium]|nr:50S ribosomal protein L29 [Candidatus Dojkabacteria bacterium]